MKKRAVTMQGIMFHPMKQTGGQAAPFNFFSIFAAVSMKISIFATNFHIAATTVANLPARTPALCPHRHEGSHSTTHGL